MDELVVIGGGEHARVVIDAARAAGLRVLGFLDPLPCVETSRLLEILRLGDDSDIRTWSTRACLFVGVGAVGVSPLRRDIVSRCAQFARWASIVHPRAVVSPHAQIEEGTLVMPGVVIGPGARVRAHAVINTGAVVEHDCEIGSFAQIGPGATLGGGVHVGEDAYLGLGCCIRDHASIGAGALVGMGAVVVSDVAAHAQVIGVPARRFDARA